MGDSYDHQCRKRADILLSRLPRHRDCNRGRKPALTASLGCATQNAVAFTNPRARMDIGSVVGAAPLALAVLMALGGILVTISYLSE